MTSDYENEMSTGPVNVHSVRWSIPKSGVLTVSQFKDAVTPLEDMFKTISDDYVFQLELTVEDGRDNWHYQGFCHTNEKVRSKQLGKRFNGPFLGIAFRTSSTAGKKNLKEYCIKTETKQAGPWGAKKLASGEWRQETYYGGKDIILDQQMYPWQREIFQRIQGEVHSRYVDCVADFDGGKGKSSLCKLLAYKKLGIMIPYCSAQNAINAVFHNQGLKSYLFNLSRSRPKNFDMAELYSSIEYIKDGHMLNTKYEVKPILMDQPHCWVFTNEPPRADCFSPDRWRFWFVVNGRLVQKTLKEVVEAHKLHRRLEVVKKREADALRLREEEEEKNLEHEILYSTGSELDPTPPSSPRSELGYDDGPTIVLLDEYDEVIEE